MLPNKKIIKSIKYRVSLSYRNEFIFNTAGAASLFLEDCIDHVIDPDDIDNFTIVPVVEYEEEPEEVFIAAEVPFPEENDGGNEDV